LLPVPPALVAPNLQEASLRAWIGPRLDPAPFVAFAAARQGNLTAGGEEPHRTWLINLMNREKGPIRAWAATRLVEAGVPPVAGATSHTGIFMGIAGERLLKAFLWGNADGQRQELAAYVPPEDWWALGAAGEIPAQAPCWARWRSQLAGVDKPAVTQNLYAIFAPRLEASDATWVLAALKAACEQPEPEPWQSMAFMLATDWLMLYGQDVHWKAFREACTPAAWGKELATLEKRARNLKLFWSAEDPQAQGVRRPPARPLQPPTGVYRPAQLVVTGFREPDTPVPALRFKYGADVRVNLSLDATGAPTAVSLQPGYGLGVFGPGALDWVGHWTCSPATLDGKPQTSVLTTSVRFQRSL
jgi:hypothetical protein